VSRIPPAICLAFALLAAPAAFAAEAMLVRVTHGEGWDALPAMVAIERGYFHEEGLVASGMAVTSAEAVIQSLVTGSSDFAVVPQRTLLVMGAADVPVKVVALSGWNTRIDLVVRKDLKGVKSLADLKGRRVAVVRGSQAHPVLMRLLNAEGLRPADIEVQLLTPGELAGALAGSGAEAIFASGHYTTRAVESGDGRVLVPHKVLVEKIGYVGAVPLVTSNQVAEGRPELARRVLRAWVKALRHIDSDPEDAAKVLQIFFHRQGIPVEDEQALAWVGMTRWDRTVWGDSDLADAEYNGWGLKAAGILKEQPSLGGMVDSRYAREALAGQQAAAGAEGP
jgi:sulfonate transport system substrate-binding protein